MDRLKGEMCMVNSIPWEKAWLDFKFQVSELQKTAVKLSSAALIGRQTKANVTKEKKWMIDEDYSNQATKYQEKTCLLAKLEQVTGKESAKI